MRMKTDIILEEVLPGYNNLFNKLQNNELLLKDIGIYCNCSSSQRNGSNCEHFQNLERFPWRFRIAQHKISYISFNEIIKCVDSTRKVYEELSRFSMIWSAYEAYVNLFNIKPWDFFKELDPIRVKILSNEIRKIDKERKFTKFLIKNSRSEAANRNLKNFIGGDNSMITFFAKEVRNIYVHGNLTANPDGIKTTDFAIFLSKLSDFFIIEIKDHFREISYKY